MDTARDKPKSIDGMVAEVRAAAARHPERASTIFGHAARRFGGMARDPRNRRAAAQLAALAERFGQAAGQVLGAHDDFAEQLNRAIEAHQLGAPDDFQATAVRQQIRDAGQRRVSIAPESFTLDTALGRYGTFKWAPSDEERRLGWLQEGTLAVWPGMKHEAQAFTVDVTLANPPELPPVSSLVAYQARPYGFVEFGVDGSKARVKFDIGFGTRFTLPANYIAVGAGMSPLATSSQGVPMRIGASIGAFAAPSLAPVTCTEFVDLLPNTDDSGLILRPMKATQLLPLLSSAAGGNTLIEFYDFNGGPVSIARYTWPSNTFAASPIPLPPDMAYVRITNSTGGVANYRLVFQLSL